MTINNTVLLEKLSWLIISETVALASFTYLVLRQQQNWPTFALLIALIILCQLPAINFLIDYFDRRKDKVRKFFLGMLVTLLVAIVLIILFFAFKNHLVPTCFGILLFVGTLWLNYNPPKWFSEWMTKLKEKRKSK